MKSKFVTVSIISVLYLLLALGCSKNETSHVLLKSPQGAIALSDATVVSAILCKSSLGPDLYCVKVKLKEKAANELKQFSADNIGKKMEIVINGEVLQSATIMAPIGSEFLIDRLTKEQADVIRKNTSST
jgi:preprotein translocase subunit SecD